MGKFIDVEATAEKIYNKYGTHPVYYVNNTEEGKDAQTDCIVLEMIYDERRMVYADVVDVVRCNDCVHCSHCDNYELWCMGRGFPSQLVTPEGFCDKGKRETND